MELQYEYECYFFVADWHALTTGYEDTPQLESNVCGRCVIDWLAAGLNPAVATLFIQSRVPEHAELHLLLSMITPLGWLERVPTYKDQQEQLKEQGPGDLRLPRLPAAAERGHPALPADVRAGGRGPGRARRDHARGRAPLQHSTAASRTSRPRPRSAVKSLGSAQQHDLYKELRTTLPGEGRRRCARHGARAARRQRPPDGRRPRAVVRLPRRPRPSASCRSREVLLTATPEGAGPRRPQDVEVLRQHHRPARGPGPSREEAQDHADRSGARAAHRPGRSGEMPGVGSAQDLLERGDAAPGSQRAAARPASAASNARSR